MNPQIIALLLYITGSACFFLGSLLLLIKEFLK